MDPRVWDAMEPYFRHEFGNPHSKDHAYGWAAAQAVEKACEQVARSIGADPDEIIFTSGATEANNLALLGIARRATGGKRRRVLVSAIEHKSILAVSRVLEEQLDCVVERLPVDVEGRVDIAELNRRLGADVLLVSIMSVNNEIGTIQSLEQISRVVRPSGALLHSDGAHAPVATNIKRFSEFVDLLSLSAHKMYGPKGIGALFVQRRLHGSLEPLIYGGEQQRSLRAGTLPAALCVGMGAAIEILDEGDTGRAEQRELWRKRSSLVRSLEDLPVGISLNGPQHEGSVHPGNLNVSFEGIQAQDLLACLQPMLAASTGSACTSGMNEPSHVLQATGLPRQRVDSSVRFSFGRFTTDQELDQAAELVRHAVVSICSRTVLS